MGSVTFHLHIDPTKELWLIMKNRNILFVVAKVFISYILARGEGLK